MKKLRPKTDSYLTDDSDENKGGKHKKFILKQKLKFEDYKH